MQSLTPVPAISEQHQNAEATKPLLNVTSFDQVVDYRAAMNRPTHVVLQESVRNTAETVLNAHKQHAAFETNLELFKHALDSGEVGKVYLKMAVNEAASNAIIVRTFLDSCLASIPVVTLPTSQSALKAHKVFTTAELFVNILAHVEPRDVLNALQINKATSQIFINSPKLQDKLHLRESKEGHVDSVFLKPRDGNRRTFPIFRLHFGQSFSYGPSPVGADPDRYKIRSETGITVGQVYDAIKQLREEHRYCPYATLEMHSADGTVSPRTRFHGKVPLKRNDPYAREQGRSKTKLELLSIQLRADQSRLGVYVQAKQTGKYFEEDHAC
ncbi:hypothetical protein LTR37_007686 [Vermiconidia calcicola]|uniref:Uncharacterized protein n=1 Tax=Vermiconidia calcicola TaxID=1690605 RepID=A0ACC3NCW1_9PEZI|nr:hypothetical protein LTR37_007686 [Vermiconidia calcicola]